MSTRLHLSEELRWRAIGRLKAVKSQSDVARWLNVRPSVIHRLWNAFRGTESASRRYSRGRARATSAADDRYLQLTARRYSTATPTHLRSSLAAATGRLVSGSTVRRRLHEGGLYARRPALCVPITPRHRNERFHWARTHFPWSASQSRSVLFTDESRFCLQSDSRRVLVWREPGTCHHPRHIRERDRFGGASVCV